LGETTEGKRKEDKDRLDDKISVNGEWKYWNEIVKEIGKENKKRDSVRVEEGESGETNGRSKDRGDREAEDDRVGSTDFA